MRLNPEIIGASGDPVVAATAQMQQLVGKPLWRCTNAADLVAFQFGGHRVVKSGEVGDIALHVQCQWRLTLHGRPVTGRTDLFVAAGSGEENLSPEGFDCYRDRTQFMEATEALFGGRVCGFLARDAKLGTAIGLDIDIEFDEGLRLQVWPGTALEYESWRLFQPYTEEPHWVCRGLQLYRE